MADEIRDMSHILRFALCLPILGLAPSQILLSASPPPGYRNIAVLAGRGSGSASCIIKFKGRGQDYLLLLVDIAILSDADLY